MGSGCLLSAPHTCQMPAVLSHTHACTQHARTTHTQTHTAQTTDGVGDYWITFYLFLPDSLSKRQFPVSQHWTREGILRKNKKNICKSQKYIFLPFHSDGLCDLCQGHMTISGGHRVINARPMAMSYPFITWQ